MQLNTASAVITFVTKHEEETIKFYEKLAQKYPEGKEFFLTYSKENQRNKVMVERTYYGVITDMLEACFAFKDGLDPAAYAVKIDLAEGASYSDALKDALEMEKIIQKLYIEAAALSEGLMADVPRAFRIIARKRGDRIAKIKALIG